VLSAAVSRLIAPALIQRLGLRMSAAGGLVVVASGFALLLRVSPDVSYATAMLPASLICLGLGMGVAYPVFTVAAVAGVPEGQQGLAAGIQNTALQVGGGLALALVSAGIAAAASGDLATQVESLRVGVAIGVCLPLIGAVVALVGLREQGVVGRV
jgi:MFS family permease